MAFFIALSIISLLGIFYGVKLKKISLIISASIVLFLILAIMIYFYLNPY